MGYAEYRRDGLKNARKHGMITAERCGL